MKTAAIILALMLLTLVAATLIPGVDRFLFALHLSAVVVAGALLAVITRIPTERKSPGAPPAAAAPPPRVPPSPSSCDAQVVALVALLQEQGRLVDFLMGDITAYGDAQVGAAARVVHEGCREVLQEHFSVVPVHEEAEGSKVTVLPGYAADEYRLVGTIRGEAPFTGRLVHRGWRTTSVKMPRLVASAGERLPTIAPAEVEL